MREPATGRAITRVGVATLVLAAGLAAATTGAGGAPGPEAVPQCAARQLTGAQLWTGALDVDGDGSHIALLSFADPDGANADASGEVMVLETATNTLTQVTDTEQSSSRSFAGPSLSSDGSLVVFSSSFDLLGTDGDGLPTHNVYLYDVAAETLEQLTAETVATALSDDHEGATISADGSTIAFTGRRNGQLGVYLIDVGTGTIELLVPLLTTSWSPVLDHDGSHVAFLSTTDAFGDNDDFGTEVFLAETATGDVTQLTTTPDGATEPWSLDLDGDATHVSYAGYGESYRQEVATGQRVRVSGASVGGFFDLGIFPSMDASGERIAFQSGRDLAGRNADRSREVFVWDAGTFNQATSISSPLTPNGDTPIISDDGTRVAVLSRGNLAGQNAAGNEELFLVCSGGAPPPPPRCDGRVVTVDLSKGQQPTNGADVILGTAGRNVINGRGGNDRICAGGGNDTVRGGGGNDRIFGQAGNDTLLGETGRDRLEGGTQRDTCKGGPQRDTQRGCEIRRSIP